VRPLSRHHLALLAALFVTVAGGCDRPPQRADTRPLLERVPGCYQLMLEKWSGPLQRWDTTPPTRFRLESTLLTSTSTRDTIRLVEPDFRAVSRGHFAYWRPWTPRAQDSVEIFWPHNLGGVRLELDAHTDTLKGLARVTRDAGPENSWPTAPAKAWRVPCR